MFAAIFSSYGLTAAPPPPLPAAVTAAAKEGADASSPKVASASASSTSDDGTDTERWLEMHDHLLKIVPTDRALKGAKGARSAYQSLPKPLKITILVIVSAVLLLVVPYGIVLFIRTMSNKKDAGRITMMVVFASLMLVAWVFVDF